MLLHERHPRLTEDIDEERQARVKDMAYKTWQRDEEKKFSSSFKTRFGSLEDSVLGSPTPEKVSRKQKTVQNEPFTPVLRPKDSQGDLIFDMDEEESSLGESPMSPTAPRSTGPHQLGIPTIPEFRRDSKGKAVEVTGMPVTSLPDSLSRSPVMPPKLPSEPMTRKLSDGGNPWGSSTLATPRLNLREVLAESKPAQSALSAGLAAEKKNESTRPVPQKMSQKERKKYLQQQAGQAAQNDTRVQNQPWAKVGDKKESPWQQPASTSKTSLKDMLSPDTGLKAPSPSPKPLVAAESSAGRSIPRRTASPDTRFSGQKTSTTPAASSSKPSRPEPQSLTPHSKSYITRAPKPEPEMGLGLADIIGQQRREQESVKEAVAKRSLQEIQQEQAFQEWWDQESKRAQEEEAKRVAREKGRGEKKEGGGGSGSGRKGRSNKSKSGGNNRGGGGGSGSGGGSGVSSSNADASSAANAQPGPGAGGRGRARGNRGGKAQ